MSGAWPYPLWIAHRGAGKLAPENTLAAFRLGATVLIALVGSWRGKLAARRRSLAQARTGESGEK